MKVKRTPWALLVPKPSFLDGMKELNSIEQEELDSISEEASEDYMRVFLNETELSKRQGHLFPLCPILNVLSCWDYDYNDIGDLY